MADVDAIIVGSGIVGLATGAALARAGKSVIVLEKNHSFGEEISARNSEVIHAGMYYPTDSSKAKFCVEGNARTYEYCGARGIMANPISKLILATSKSEIGALEALFARGIANGVPNMEIIDKAKIKALEPDAVAEAAIFAPSSGIVDSHSLMLALLGEIEDNGGALARMAPFAGAKYINEEWQVSTSGTEATQISATNLILSAGLWSTNVAQSVVGLGSEFIPQTKLAKGNYFRYLGKAPFSRLIYPMPSAGGLGIHLTPDAAGHARFGPDVEEISTIDYKVNEGRKHLFAQSIKAYWPQMDENLLAPDYAGIRPKIGDALKSFEDFRILDAHSHKLSGLICLFGIDSPGLTSCMAIGNEVLNRILQFE